jgi:hypothetical protein
VLIVAAIIVLLVPLAFLRFIKRKQSTQCHFSGHIRK